MVSGLEIKQCPICLETKELNSNNFHKNRRNKDKFSVNCKICFNKIYRDYYKKNSHKINALKKTYWEINKKKSEKYRIKKKYGITIEDRNKMIQLQNNKCYICKVDGTKLKTLLHIDHCHRTNKVRKLLCYFCNTALGSVKENINTLHNMISYLQEHNNV